MDTPVRAERPAERGLTLVETLVTVLLLAFVVLGGAATLGQVLHQNKLARHRSLATYLAAERIDQLTSQRYHDSAEVAEYQLAGETLAAGPPATLTADYGSLPDFPEFRRVLTLSYDVPVAGMLQVSAEVFWRDLQQGEKSHELISYIHPSLEQMQ
jgi:type II secretory pathway pseudopilin PulG